MPSSDVGAEVFRNRARNCRPWVRSLTQSPEAVTHSPAEIIAACPMVVTSSLWPRAFRRSTQKPLSRLWKVTRSTRPARTSCSEFSTGRFIQFHLGRDVWLRLRPPTDKSLIGHCMCQMRPHHVRLSICLFSCDDATHATTGVFNIAITSWDEVNMTMEDGLSSGRT